MKPLQLRRPGAQVERKRPAAENDLGFSEQTIAFFAAPAAVGAGSQIARGGIGRPRLAVFAVEPAARRGQSDRRINRLDFRPLGGCETLDIEDVDASHLLVP